MTKVTTKEIQKEVIRICSEYFKRELTLSSNLEKIGLDDISSLIILLELENIFSCELSLSITIYTVEDLVKLVCINLGIGD